MANLSNINNKLLVGTNGEVRIGDTATIANVKLRVKQTAQQWTAQFVNTDSSVAYGISIDTSASSYGVAGTLQCYTNSGGGFIVRNDSKVGIGVTGPTAKLHIGVSSANDDTFHIFNGSVRTHLLGSESSNGVIYLRSSANSNKVRINTSGDSYFNGGNVGIGTASPNSYSNQTVLTINGSTYGRLDLESGGTLRSSLFSQAANTSLTVDSGFFTIDVGGSERMRIDSLGNVGIGTTSPSDKLTLNSSGSGTGFKITGYQPENFINLNNILSTGNRTFRLISGITSVGYDGFSIFDTVSNATRFVIDNGGNVGIGTTAPDVKLHVETTASSTARFAYNGSNYQDLNWEGSNIVGGSHVFKIGGSEKMRIDSSGKVGIGTTSPGAPLEIAAESTNVGNTLLNIGNAIVNPNTRDSWIKMFGSQATVDKTFAVGNLYGKFVVNYLGTRATNPESGGTKMFTVDGSTGNVGIGTTSPANKLFVTASTAGDYAAFIENTNSTNGYGLLARTAQTGTSSYAFAARAGSSDIFVVRGDGNVGIGTTNPIQKLDTPNIIIGGSTIAGAYRANALFMDNNGGNSRFYSSGPNGTTQGSYEFNIMASDANPLQTVLVINSSGNVGIGTAPVTNAAYNKVLHINAASGVGAVLKLTDASSGSGANNGLEILQYAQESYFINRQNGAMYFYTNNNPRMTILPAGNVGIGTTSPSAKLDIGGNTAGSVQATFGRGNNDNNFAVRYINGDAGTNNTIQGAIGLDYANGTWKDMASVKFIRDSTAGELAFYTSSSASNGTEKMRITSAGVIQNESTTSTASGAVRFSNNNFYWGMMIEDDALSTGFILFSAQNGDSVGSITRNGALNTSFNTVSDYRLKEDLQDFEGLDMVSKIPVYDFKWKPDESRSYGVMAHELQEVLPDAVVGKKDAEEMQQVDYSKIVPLLVKSIQELEAKIKILENK